MILFFARSEEISRDKDVTIAKFDKNLFKEFQDIFEIPLINFCETLHNRRQAPKVYVT